MENGGQKAWWTVFSYLGIYLLLSILKGYYLANWLIISQTWLILGYILTGGIIYFAKSTLTDRKLQLGWSYILVGLVCFAFTILLRFLFSSLNLFGPLKFIQNDFGFIIGIPFIWIGLLLFPSQPRLKVTRLRALFDFSLSLITYIILIVAIFFQPLTSILLGRTWSILAGIILLMDMISIAILIYIFLMGDVKSLSLSKGWLVFGIVAYTISDGLYAINSTNSNVLSGGVEDFSRLLANVFFIMSVLMDGDKSNSWTLKGSRTIYAILYRVQSYFPLLLGFLLSCLVFSDTPINMMAFWGTVIIALGLIARQGLQIGEDEMQKYADLVNHIAEPTFICDSKGVIKLFNPAFFELSGKSAPGNLNNHNVLDLFSQTDDIKKALNNSLESGWSGEARININQENQVPVYLSLRLLTSDPSGKLTIAGTAHDLTDQKSQQIALQEANLQINADREELEQMNLQLEIMVAEKTKDLKDAYSLLEDQNRTLQQLDLLKSDFVGLVSHELRAPLTNIRGGIELLQRMWPLPKNIEENLNLVQAEVLRLTRFVETILDLTALDAGRFPFYPAPISLQSVLPVINTLLTFLPGVERINWNIPDDLPFIMADSQALTSVIFHLVDNALKYAVEGKIDVTAGVTGEKLFFKVSDEGPGIGQEALPHLFQRFYRSSSDSQSVYGHGLGLYIVKRMLEAMSGEIEVRNNPDKGASFTFYLPLVIERGKQDV